jgi:hypothetical protein
VLADAGGRPYVAFYELDPGSGSLFPGNEASNPAQIWVMRLSADRAHWETVGGGPVNLPAQAGDPPVRKDAVFPDLAIVDGRPWVVYFQVVMRSSGPVTQVQVARLNDAGTGWQQVGAPLAEGEFGAVSFPVIAAVGGVPMVAFSQPEGGGRPLSVYRLDAAGGSWQRMGGTPAIEDGGVEKPSLADVGGNPWVAARGNNGGVVARFAGGTWSPAGGTITGLHDNGLSDGPHLAAVGGLPWVAFGEGDGQSQGSPGCCNQVRVTRLAPDFGASSFYPAATTAALLLSVQTWGLPYSIGVLYGPAGTEPLAQPLAAPAGSELIAGLRGLTPGTLYTYAPYAFAGTQQRLVGAGGRFVTPPASDSPIPQPSPPVATPPRATLLLAILRAPSSFSRRRSLRLVVVSTEGGVAQLTVKRGKRVVKRISRTVPAGRWSLTWKPRGLKLAKYRLTVRLRAADGSVRRDAFSLRLKR